MTATSGGMPPTPPVCGRPTAVQPTPNPDETAPGAHVGPLWFVFGGTAKTAQSELYPDKQGRISPTKVPNRRSREDAEARDPARVAVRCRDSTPLRFWYRVQEGGAPLAHNPTSPQELQRAGDLIATLPREPTLPSIPGYHGYLLFSATGKWVVSVAVQGQQVGSFVVNVTEG